VSSDEREEELLRAVALETSKSILRARQRAEREVLATKEALEKKTSELAESLARLRATLESTFDGILVTDGQNRVTGFNQKLLGMWDLPRAGTDGGDPGAVLEACAAKVADPVLYRNRIEEIRRTSPPESADILELLDGRVYERHSTIQYLNGNSVGRVWSFRDITAQKQADFALRQQREWFEVTLGSIGDAVITTDMRAKVTYLNPVAEELTGWTSAEARGAPLEQVFRIVNEYTGQEVENPIGKVLREGTIVGLANHTALLARDGRQIPIEDSAAPIRDAAGVVSGAVMVFHDVSVRRTAEEALRDADRRKDEFLATLAHELRNPLAPIRQAARISKAPNATEAQKRWSHDVIERQVHHMSLLLDDLLDISRVTRGILVLRKQPTDLTSMIDAAVETARPSIDAKRHNLRLQIPTEPLQFMADPLRMAQVLSNLLTNAAKYTDPEGTILLAATCELQEVVIRVSDNGVGIAADALPEIFEMFAQVHATRDRSEGGLGIGLALTRGLVELHGGKIEVRSAGLGRGSEFTVRLPCAVTAEPGGQRQSVSESPAARSRRILIADDNRDSAETLAALLRMQGHQVTIVHDGPAAVGAFTDLAADVVVLDIGMPGLDGYEVAQKMRRSRPAAALTLIAVTGWGQEHDKERAFAAGFDYHLTKPVDFDRLAQLVQLDAGAHETNG
jgi:PAS domain S-box-containing protein